MRLPRSSLFWSNPFWHGRGWVWNVEVHDYPTMTAITTVYVSCMHRMNSPFMWFAIDTIKRTRAIYVMSYSKTVFLSKRKATCDVSWLITWERINESVLFRQVEIDVAKRLLSERFQHLSCLRVLWRFRNGNNTLR